MRKPFSVVSVDLKGDSHQAKHTIEYAIGQLERQSGFRMPLLLFNLSDSLPTHIFNVFESTAWLHMSLDARAAILASAAGLIYPPGYGPDYFGGQGFGLFIELVRRFPDARSFVEYCEGVQIMVRRGLLSRKAQEDSELAQKVLRRLAGPIQLNAIPGSRAFPNAKNIDFATFFQKPSAAHLCLSSELHPYLARDVGRLASSTLIRTGQLLGKKGRKCNVLFFVDEFPDMQDYSLHQTLRYCRSHGVAIVLTNQQRADLKAVPGMLDAVEGSIQLKLYFGLNSREDINWLSDLGGEAVETFRDTSETWGPQGASQSVSSRHVLLPRINTTEVAGASSIPGRCIAHITCEPWCGLPFEMDVEHDVSKDTYDGWEEAPWPSDVEGTIVPNVPHEEKNVQKKPARQSRNEPSRVLSVERYKAPVEPTSGR